MIKFVGIVAVASSLLSLGSAQAQLISQPSQIPGWTNLQACVTDAVAGGSIESGSLYYLGCQNYVCGCNAGGSGAALSEIALIDCGNSAAATAATSFWSTFCSQVLSTSSSLSATQASILPSNMPTTSFSPTTSFVAQLSQPSQLPGWTNLRSCVTNAIVGGGFESGILYYAGCHNYACACSDADAGPTLSQIASIYCSDSAAGATATSVWDSFCSQLVASPGGGSPTSSIFLT
jgi:hypothetical protein